MLTAAPPVELPPLPPQRRSRIVPALAAIALLGAAAAFVVPKGLEARHLFAIENDPVQIADREIAASFTPDRARQEIDMALAANDADLAQSFVELAKEQGIVLEPAQVTRVSEAVAKAASNTQMLESFAQGFVTGEPKDAAGLAGTIGGDLMVFGDIRDAVREGSRWAAGEQVDELVLGLAAVGLALTATTYASSGVAAPARVGVSVVKAARRAGKLSADLTAYVGRALRSVVDWPKLKSAITGASVTEPMLAVRAAREAVKVERAGGLTHLVRDVGRVQARAGTNAALDGLRIAQTPAEMSRLAALAAAKGSKTRAILKVAGRGAIMLTLATVNLASWILGAMLTLFGLVASLKSTTERVTQRMIDRGKRRRFARQQGLAAATGHG